jgi:hypothetical protein
MFFIALSKDELKRERRRLSSMDRRQSPTLLATFQDDGDCRNDSLSYLQELGNVLNRQQAQADQDAGHLHNLPR